MRTKVSVDILSEKEVESISCEAFYLLQNGWKRVDADKYSHEGLKLLSEKYIVSSFEGHMWFKKDAKHIVYLDHKSYFDKCAVEINLFSRDEAYDYEMTKSAKIDDL